jgi:HAAS
MNAADSDAQAALDRYLAAVTAALADLPADVRDELVEDLPAHFAEVLQEDDGTLEERLGPPAAYAAELRAAAGLDAGTGPRRGGERVSQLAERAVGWVRIADERVGSWLGYRRASEFVRLLEPGWFVLRGFAVAILLLRYGPLHEEHLRDPFGWAVMLVMIVLSVRFGPIRRRLARLPRLVGWIATGATALVSLLVLLTLVSLVRPVEFGSPSYVVDERSQITDVYPYDSNGQPLHDVTLYDQNGNPLQFGDFWRCVDPNTMPTGPIVPKYPLCHGPRFGPLSTPQPTPTPSASASAEPTPTPSPTGSPSPSR